MGVIRATCVLEHSSGLARDNAVNTFHFNGPTDEATLGALKLALDRFYVSPNTGGSTAAVGEYISNVMTGLRFKLYDVTAEPSGPPILDQPSGAGLPAVRLNSANLPSEVALCGSFEGLPAAGLVQKRRRGRIYLGPLNIAASTTSGTGVTRPSTGVRTTLQLALQRLALEVDSVAEMVVYSRPYAGREAGIGPNGKPFKALPARPGTTVNIEQVWVDDAFDTQRRRGERATGRGTILATA